MESKFEIKYRKTVTLTVTAKQMWDCLTPFQQQTIIQKIRIIEVVNKAVVKQDAFYQLAQEMNLAPERIRNIYYGA